MRSAEFERLYAEHANALFGFLMYRTGDRALAEDVVADTFERALRARRGFDRRRGSEKTWLYAIALNRLRDQVRRTGAEERAVSRFAAGAAEHDDAAAIERVEARQTVSGALEVLSDKEREAIALRFGGELTLKEIAKLTGEPMTTVEGRVYRALRKLKDSLEPEA
jgi:RNA polymerase sigma-70 factor (ECF subfamily)